MNGIKSFALYEEYYELITLLDREESSELLLAIAEFMFEDKEPILNDKQMKIFNNLKRPLIKSKEQSKRRTKQEPNDNQIITNEEPNIKPNKNTSNDVYVNVNNNVLESNKRVIGEKEKTFKKPTIDEIADYCDERDNNINANEFYDFYESKGWMIGKNKMKDWKACIRTWEKRNNISNLNLDNVPEWFEGDF